MTIDYKAIYELRDAEQAIFAAERKVAEAKRAVDEARASYQARCAKYAGVPVDKLSFPDESCTARHILRHVFLIKVPGRHGHHSNKCIFCGNDNADSL